jgi:guanylate kinase
MVHGHYYGTRLESVREVISKGEDLILEIDVQGAAQVGKTGLALFRYFWLHPRWKLSKKE